MNTKEKQELVKKLNKLTDTLAKKINGGAGSGNFGHAGRPGKRGGSAPEGGGGSSKGLNEESYDQALEQVKKNPDSVSWVPVAKLDDGRDLCLVFGYTDAGYEKGDAKYQIEQGDTVYTLCTKLAVNIDDLQADYGMDWYMPSDKKTGEVWDTDTAAGNKSDIKWYKDEAKDIVKEFKKGKLTV